MKPLGKTFVVVVALALVLGCERAPMPLGPSALSARADVASEQGLSGSPRQPESTGSSTPSAAPPVFLAPLSPR